MEHVLNHALSTSEPRGQYDRRMRPQSAFVPRQSYFKQKGEDDDVGRPVLQHKPLDKGEFTQLSLAKVFEDDPGMRPKIFAPPSVNKISYALMSHDIAGAVPVLKCAPHKPRDTDPNAPRYVLPGTSSATVEAATTTADLAAAVPTAAADVIADAPVLTPRQPYQPYSTQQTQQQQHRNARDTLNVSDINAVNSVTERAHKLETRNTPLNTRDVEGSWPGWEPPFRAHVGKNLRDPGLDVSDISGTYRRRRIFSARPTLGSNRGSAGALSSASRETPSRPPPAPHAAAAATTGVQLPDQRQPCEASVSGERQQPQQQPSYLPPPLSWQPVQYETGNQQPWSSEGSSGGSSGATRRYSHPIRQLRQDSQQQPDEQPQKQEEPVVHAAGAWPTTVTLPLRPAISPPPFATHIPTGSVAAVLSTALDPVIASQTAAVADHPAATVGKPTPGRRDARARHNAKIILADVQRADSAEAQRVISLLRPSREAVEEFFSSCRRLDREACGKVAPTDFLHAVERANLLEAVASSTAGTGVEPVAAAKALARGLQDGYGMVSYRNLAKALLGQSFTRLSSSSKAPVPAAPVAPVTVTAAARTQASAAAAAAAAAPATTTAINVSPAALDATLSAVAEAAELRVPQGLVPASGAGAALRPTISRQTSDIQGDGNAKVGRPVHADGSDSGSGIAVTATNNDGDYGAKGSSDEPSETVAAQGTMAARRCVNWAPQPPAQGADPVPDNSQLAAPAMPRTPPNPQDQRRLELQEQQLRREGSVRRRPCSAMPGGSKGAGAVAEVFKLLGAAQPILYDTPAPLAVHVPAKPAAVPTPVAQVPAPSVAADATRTPAANTPPQQDALVVSAPATSTPAAEPYDGMGFGPHWPPEPRPSNLQKRSTATIMEGSNLQLRDVCDMTYFPYKAHALWFGGRVGPDGAEAPGGPADAAREYQPSVDPLSFLVGKGQHRVHIPPTGHRLEPEVEAALIAKLRPKSALGGSPEADVRVKTASSLVNQLSVDNPLLYPGRVDPTTPAGEALKSMLGSLYSTAVAGSSTGASGNRAAAAGVARPATASPRRSTHSRSASVSKSVSLPSNSKASGGVSPAGSIRVGRAALERLIRGEELAAVRRLC
ncbi:hypothetical protein VaNZ11_012467 [Volvox africanus]|uniref:EF-hand domain-containing protein n=1 Tax=Volvox africanus TaxID=51714 RepID=A0ABQ5SDX1_9CHLO|nr:hypothetical protein VaNZ11_012467 [Volvox africanus]